MFKSLLGSLNGPSAPDKSVGGEKQPLPSEHNASPVQATANKANLKTSNGFSKGDAGKPTKVRTLSKRSRQRLSAMMGKFQSLGRQKANAKEANGGSQPPAESLGQQAAPVDSLELGGARVKDSERKDADDDTDSSSSREFLSAEFDLEPSADSDASGARRAASEEVPEETTDGQYVDKGSSYNRDAEQANYVLPEEQCDIPTFLHTKNCDPYLIEETRRLLKERFAKNPDNFYEHDFKRMLTDNWTVSRFLLRRRLEPKRTAKLMEECGRFRRQYKMSEVQLHEFPIEFHKAGGLFKFAPDRVGNLTVYMRVKMYRRVPEISDVFKAFILCVLEEADKANEGRGTAIIFDLSACGLQNVDLAFLSWLLSSFRNYCPKGVSYILVYNLPWILNATCKLAMTWMSANNRRALRFVYGDEIENFIQRDNLPDYLGGTCKIDYRAVPEGSKPAIEVCDKLDMTREQALKIRELFKEYLDEEDFTEEEKRKGADAKWAKSAKSAKKLTWGAHASD